MNIEIAGENSLIIYFSEHASPQVSAQVQKSSRLLQNVLADVLVDVVPSYASLLIIYDPLLTDNFYVLSTINRTLSDSSTAIVETGKVVTLPVYYSTESGADLERIALHSKLSVDEVIDIHQQSEYRVYAIGFAPGFAYLGEVDARIAMPRLATPRLKVPLGAVAIADRQTAVYPAESPGGWNIIGLCPQRMFDPKATPTMPVEVGDTVKFKAVSRSKFIALGGVI
ncbi:5-oxoprolinase subunit PxpB [Thalassotalea nanhaiensis]|uniref:5-oxoprolinase subunit PxpB n=1 Tax=Thalassotalea nanhaiensis TaxID=3065648 RepID=A0ABY9TNR2_9GAMM|nr:5-oxoprolinase subunit PxpB [Colwelliaceae bacterium SQ345]